MSDRPTSGVLRRIAKAPAPPAPPAPLTPARALRLAMTRAADLSIALPLAVLSIREEEGPLDDLLSRLEPGLLLLALRQDGAATGLVALDGQARAAAIEVQALGSVSAAPPDPREVTAADAALARPLLAAFLREAEGAIAGTPLDGWLRSPDLAERLPSAREIPLLLGDGTYRAVRLSLDLGAGGRQGLLLLLSRLPEPAAAPSAEAGPDGTVAPQVLRAAARVDAILHRLRLPLGAAEGLRPGQLLPLPGVTVASVQLEAGGVPLGPARLGQVAGMRAIRIETPLAPSLAPIPHLSGPGAPASLLPPDEASWPSLLGDGAPALPPATEGDADWPLPAAAAGEGGWPSLPEAT